MSNPDMPRCCGLDDNGKQCRRKAAMYVRYHGEGGTYWCTGRVGWVRVPLCDRCFPVEKAVSK